MTNTEKNGFKREYCTKSYSKEKPVYKKVDSIKAVGGGEHSLNK